MVPLTLARHLNKQSPRPAVPIQANKISYPPPNNQVTLFPSQIKTIRTVDRRLPRDSRGANSESEVSRLTEGWHDNLDNLGTRLRWKGGFKINRRDDVDKYMGETTAVCGLYSTSWNGSESRGYKRVGRKTYRGWAVWQTILLVMVFAFVFHEESVSFQPQFKQHYIGSPVNLTDFLNF
jgi:hypothetical protein